MMSVMVRLQDVINIIGNWRLSGVMLMEEGITTEEHLLVPECAHTVTMEWYSAHQDDHVSNKIVTACSNEC